MNLMQQLLDGDLSLLAGTAVDFEFAVSHVPINAYLATQMDPEQGRLEIKCLTDNKARVKVKIKKGLAIERDFLVEIEGGVGSQHCGVLVLHLREGFHLIDGIPLMFSSQLNKILPPGVTFICEFAKDRFRIDLRKVLAGAGLEHFFELLKKFELRTKDERFHVSASLAAEPGEKQKATPQSE